VFKVFEVENEPEVTSPEKNHSCKKNVPASFCYSKNLQHNRKYNLQLEKVYDMSFDFKVLENFEPDITKIFWW